MVKNNKTYRTITNPKIIENGHIFMIFKHGRIPSYRPVCLLSSISKTVERIIENRLEKCIVDLQILPEHKFVFRRVEE